MKKFIIFLTIVIIIALVVINNREDEYLRIHIRANSNNEIDQAIKLEIKDKLVAYLKDRLSNSKSKEESIEIIKKEKEYLTQKIDLYLADCGFSYKSKIEIKREYFPQKAYGNLVLEGGEYDAIIISLGEGEGNNWWCVAFPPLCFKSEPNSSIVFKSYIKELFIKIGDYFK